MSWQRTMSVSLLAAGLILFGAPSPALAVPNYSGDVDGDGDVDLSDLAALLSAYGTCTGDEDYNPDADFDGSGCVGLSDLATLLANYGTSLSPDMVLIPAGEFMMGDTFDEGGSDQQPVHAVYVDAFYTVVYEVTNEEYAAGLNWAWAQGNLISVSDGVVCQYGSGTS